MTWFECPVPETVAAVPEIGRLRRCANARGMRLAGCENFAYWEAFAPFVDGGCYDVIMPDVKYAGGLAALQAIATRAADADVATSIHNPAGPVGHMVSLHATAALDSDERLEHQYRETPLFDALTEGEVPPRSVSSAVPETPGLGIGLRDFDAWEDAGAGTRSHRTARVTRKRRRVRRTFSTEPK